MTELPPSLAPFDLAAPAQLLVPGPPHDRDTYRQQSVKLGSDGSAVLTVATWGDCRPRCRGGSAMSSHEAGSSVRLTVPCENLPHCHYCECGSGHSFVLSPEQVAELRGILP